MNHSLTLPNSIDPDSLTIQDGDLPSLKFLMLLEGASTLGAEKAAHKYGFSPQRYHQLLTAFKTKGYEALINQKPGPKNNSARTEPVKNLVVRYKFLDPDQSAEVIAQKLRQQGHKISDSSVGRIIAEFGISKKTFIV